MSARGSTAKISSLSSMSPPLPASRVCTLTFILAFLAFVGIRGRLRAALSRFGFFVFCGLGRVGSFNFGGLGSFSLSSSTRLLLGGDRRDLLVARQGGHLMHGGIINETRLRHFEIFDLAAFEDRGRIWRSVGTRQLHG